MARDSPGVWDTSVGMRRRAPEALRPPAAAEEPGETGREGAAVGVDICVRPGESCLMASCT